MGIEIKLGFEDESNQSNPAAVEWLESVQATVDRLSPAYERSIHRMFKKLMLEGNVSDGECDQICREEIKAELMEWN